MSFNLLKGKRGIIFGALNDASIAWKVAERAVEEGAQIVLTNTAVACRMGTIDELAKKTGAVIIPADATSVEDLTNLFVQAQEALGGKIDFVDAVRFEKGEGIEKKQENFAEEIASMIKG